MPVINTIDLLFTSEKEKTTQRQRKSGLQGDKESSISLVIDTVPAAYFNKRGETEGQTRGRLHGAGEGTKKQRCVFVYEKGVTLGGNG